MYIFYVDDEYNYLDICKISQFEREVRQLMSTLSYLCMQVNMYQCLSLAERLTLSKSVLNFIPYYHMQYAKLLKTLCDEIEKIQRGFLWGDTDQIRKPHLINWEVCCLPKGDGGLGIRNQKQMNEAFLMKILWNMINKPDDLWCKVLYSKYGRNKDLRVAITSQPYDSPLWKALAGI